MATPPSPPTTTADTPVLLSIPCGDLEKSKEPPLVLLQLPPDCSSPSQLRHFVADAQRASLVTDTASYSVHTLGTSNSIVLVPPNKESRTSTTVTDDGTTPCSKRLKSTITTTTARLLHQGSGASYLELRLRTVPSLTTWMEILQREGPTTTCQRLARRLHLADTQVRDYVAGALSRVVYPSSTTTTMTTYTLMKGPDRIACERAILATLTECYEDYGGREAAAATFLEQAMERCCPRGADNTALMTFCVQQLCTASTTTTFRFDVEKVAACVADHLLREHSAPSWEHQDFMDQWQLGLPGTNETVDPRMLRGIAVRDDKGSWVYLPSYERTTWEVLFDVKESWTEDELAPYLDRMILLEPATTFQELLATYTVPAKESESGKEALRYKKKAVSS